MVYNIVNRRNAGAGACPSKFKIPFFETEPRAPDTLDEIHGCCARSTALANMVGRCNIHCIRGQLRWIIIGPRKHRGLSETQIKMRQTQDLNYWWCPVSEWQSPFLSGPRWPKIWHFTHRGCYHQHFKSPLQLVLNCWCTWHASKSAVPPWFSSESEYGAPLKALEERVTQ